ncbi:PqqD family protein [Streptomyces sp. NPDC088915]|uniref:PqqD family protein n=1 Tax=Streptomyces sp. NPDC088915 TaxID=3365912 RepID=UPI00382954A1
MLTVPEHVHWGRCGGGTAVLNLRDGQWRMFSGHGARIWEAVVLRGGIEGLAEEIAIPAGLDVAATHQAVDDYLAGLVDMGLLARVPVQARRRRRRWWR